MFINSLPPKHALGVIQLQLRKQSVWNKKMDCACNLLPAVFSHKILQCSAHPLLQYISLYICIYMYTSGREVHFWFPRACVVYKPATLALCFWPSVLTSNEWTHMQQGHFSMWKIPRMNFCSRVFRLWKFSSRVQTARDGRMQSFNLL